MIARTLTIYHADGRTESWAITEPPTLEEMQEIVGGYIEYVKLPLGHGHKKMVVNEEGLLRGLSPNWKASEMAGRPIVGNVLVY